MSNTIVALATPLGRSGIGVIRLSGKDSLSIARRLVRDENFSPKPRFAALQKIYDLETTELLDAVLITYFQSPQSFTGEDVIEISGHGSPVVLRQIIDFCLKLNARMADAGEFSLRALANGQMNLSQAEAIRDLIDAQSVAAARQSVRQLSGELSNRLQPLKDNLLDIIVVLESSLEFVEDDLPDFQAENIRQKLNRIVDELNRLASTFQAGKLLREGIKVALVGRPNVGKSSLFNALLGQERAIVTEIAGTTRDQIHEKFTINDIPIALIDTAGLRETSDVVESIGVERSKRTMADADLIIILLDGSEDLMLEDKEIISQVAGLNYIVVINKSDLPQSKTTVSGNFKAVRVSAKTGIGLDDLQKAIIEPFLSQNIDNAGFLISDARHNDLLLRAVSEIETSLKLIDDKMSEEIILIGLHNAMLFLGQVTGETTTEDMLTRIFSTFCIGK